MVELRSAQLRGNERDCEWRLHSEIPHPPKVRGGNGGRNAMRKRVFRRSLRQNQRGLNSSQIALLSISSHVGPRSETLSR